MTGWVTSGPIGLHEQLLSLRKNESRLAVAGLSAAGAYPATATSVEKITSYSSPKIHLSTASYTSNGITVGPGGALWFTNPGNNTIGRITTTGRVKDYKGAGIANPWAITAGPGGALWFTDGGFGGGGYAIGRITTSGISDPSYIAAGPDGALWFTAKNAIGRITTTR